MKKAISGLLILGVSVLLSGFTRGDQNRDRPEEFLGDSRFLPQDDEIPGWKRSEKFLKASTEEELFKIFNGGASLYLNHGFLSYVGQSYRGQKGSGLEVHIFEQRTPQNARDLYEDPFAKPSRSKEIANLGEKARIDMGPLFCYEIDFIQKAFFLRVIIQDKTEEGLDTALSFARFISARIQ